MIEDSNHIFKNRWSYTLKDPELQKKFKEYKLKNIQEQTPWVLLTLALLLLQRVIQLMRNTQHTDPDVKTVIEFEFVVAFLSILNTIIFYVASFRYLFVL